MIYLKCEKCQGTDIGEFFIEDLQLTHCICACGQEWVQ